MKNTLNLRILYSVITGLLLMAAVSNIIHFAILNPRVSDQCFWTSRDDGEGLEITTVVRGGTADKAGIRESDILLRIDDLKIGNIEQAQTYVDQHKPGDVLIFHLERDGRPIEAAVTLIKRSPLMPAISFGVGLLFLLVGFLVVFKKPLMRTPRLFYFFSWTFSVMLSFNYFSQDQQFYQIIRVVHFTGIILWGPSMVHFFMNFPLRLPLLHKHPNSVFIFYIPAVVVFGYMLIFDASLEILANLVVGLYFAASFVLLGYSSDKITNPHERKSIRVVNLGMYFGLAPLGILAFFPEFLINLFGLTAVAATYCLMGLVPISFGYSIMRYGLMDVEIIFKRSLVYSLWTSSFVLLYFIVVMGLGGYLANTYGFGGQAANLFFLILVAVAFQPVRNAIQNFVDKRFFRERHEYQQTLLRLSQDLPGQTDITAITGHVSKTISSAMNVSEVTVNLYDEGRSEYILHASCNDDCETDFTWKAGSSGLVDILKRERTCCLFYKIEEDERYNELPITEKIKIEKAGIILSVPMYYKEDLIGMINLGPKASTQVYSQEDMDLLMTVAGNTAIALSNARLHLEEVQRKQLENELSMARKIQEGLLPKSDPVLPGFEITGVSIPSSLMGGDYFDFIRVSKSHFLFLVGDVSGKGMPAAIYMSKIQGMIQMAASNDYSPKNILVNVNRQIYRKLDRNAFITMTVGLLDVERGKLTVSRAGHMPMLLNHKNESKYIYSKGIGLGLEQGDLFNHQLEEAKITLKKGDTCILFSDGLTEAMNPQKETYGEDRLLSLVQSNGYQSVVELKDLILSDIETFQAGELQNDDITIVLIRRLA